MISPLVRNLLVMVALAAAPASNLLAHDIGEEMAASASRFIASLDEAGKKTALMPFDLDERKRFNFVPDRGIKGGRAGLPIKQMTPQQRLLAHALLSTALSHEGYRQTLSIMSMERVLFALENSNASRDPEVYYLSIFGTPAADKTWGWRFEGHHLSINITLPGGKPASLTPSFWGTNPAQIKDGPMAGLEVLAAEQTLGRKLAQSLDEEQRKLALLTQKAPADVITGSQRKADRAAFLPARGIPFEKLNPDQQKLLLDLVRTFTGKYRPEIIAQIASGKKKLDGSGMHFAWAGGMQPGEGHYYRVQTAEYLFEYDNTQNGANHVHVAWRDFDGDFGADLLADHHEKHHAPVAESAK